MISCATWGETSIICTNLAKNAHTYILERKESYKQTTSEKILETVFFKKRNKFFDLRGFFGKREKSFEWNFLSSGEGHEIGTRTVEGRLDERCFPGRRWLGKKNVWTLFHNRSSKVRFINFVRIGRPWSFRDVSKAVRLHFRPWTSFVSQQSSLQVTAVGSPG